MRCFTMVRVTTSINIDSDKRELAKKRGLVLSDILDQALDIALGIELKESTKLMENKEDLETQKEILQNEKDKFLKDHARQVKDLEDDKERYLKNYLKDHEAKLQSLEDDKESYLKNYDSNISEIDFKLKSIDKALEGAIIEDKEDIKKKEYNKILQMALKSGGVDPRDNELMNAIEGFADKYEMTDKEFIQLQEDINEYVINNW